MMTQSSSVVFDFLVDEILEMGWVQGSSDDFLKTCTDVVNSCGLEELMGRKFNTLSGGEQQRVQFARALLQVGGLSKAADDRFCFWMSPPRVWMLRMNSTCLIWLEKSAKLVLA